MNNNTLLLRQINPTFIQDGRATSQAFRPTPKDEKQLSVYDNDLISPTNAYQHFIEVLHLQSVGVMAVSVNECHTLDLPPLSDPSHFTEHALIDFSAFENKAIEKKSKKLKVFAQTRDWLYQP